MDGRGRRHMRCVCRRALPAVALALVLWAPPVAQSHLSPLHRAKAGGATCLDMPATLKASPQNHLLVGTPRADVIVGTRAADQIHGGGGDDLICGGGGSDLLAGGPGKDQLSGGSGNDLVLGGAGMDRLTGGSGDDHLDGGADRDECAGDGGTNSYVSCEVKPDNPPSAGQIDGQGGSAQVNMTIGEDDNLTIEEGDNPPSAVDDAKVLDENSDATFIDVLSNDTDVDGGPKTVESVTEPTHGKVSITAGGAGLTYKPLADYCNDGEASDTLTYTLNGGSVATVTARVVCVTTVLANPSLTPSFDPDVTDYTTRCTGEPLEVFGRAAEGTAVAVDGGQPATARFDATVPLEENQEFSFSVTDPSGTHAYFVRCLPSNFPMWEYERFLPPRSDLYVVAPTLGAGAQQFAVIFDRNGVPVWWDTESPGRIINATVLEDETIAWWRDNHGFIVHNLGGSVLGEINTVTGPTDLHELQQEPSGNYLLISSKIREHIDLTEYGYGPDEEVHDYIVEEVNPQGQLVWSWDTANHIGLGETGRWWLRLSSESPRDIVHMNAIEAAGENAVLVSLRHTDAIYKVDKSTGEILWKLGGTWTPKSLKVVNDPEGAYPLGGPHDVRLMPDGTITIYDNNTDLPSVPRAVRYEIDEAQRTATLVEEVSDPLVSQSFCCGSARRAVDGSWLLSWGGRSLVTEFDPGGQRTFSLGFGGTVFSYRAVPVEDGALSVPSLRAGMDVMNPR
jgi:hypothetical protein